MTHSLTFLSQVDTIVVLQDGAISEVGSFTELLERDGPFSEFLNQYLVNTDEYSKNDDFTGKELGLIIFQLQYLLNSGIEERFLKPNWIFQNTGRI